MVDKIEITTGKELSKYLTGFSKSVDKLNKISERFQSIKSEYSSAQKVANNLGDARGTKQFFDHLSRDLKSLSKEIRDLNATDKMMARHMKNIAGGSGFHERIIARSIGNMGGYMGGSRKYVDVRHANPVNNSRVPDIMGLPQAEVSGYERIKQKIKTKNTQYREPYDYDPMDKSKTQIHGAFRNMVNPGIDSAGGWFGRRKSAFGFMKSNINNLTFNRDANYRNRNNPKWDTLKKDGTPRQGIPIPSMYHALKELGGHTKDFLGMRSSPEYEKDDDGNVKLDEDGNKIEKKKKGLGSKIKGGLKNPLALIGGVAGIAGLGKKLIDSSPMLQAMMKMLSTTFTLILRPIGDFVGGILRPISLFMLKEIAIPMAKNGKQFMKFGEEVGNKILGFFLRPIESIKQAIILGINPLVRLNPFYDEANDKDYQWAKNYDGVTDWKLQKIIDNTDEESTRHKFAKETKKMMKEGNLSSIMREANMEYLDKIGGNNGNSMAFGIQQGALEEMTDKSEEAVITVDEFLANINKLEASGKISSEEAAQYRKYMQDAKNAGITSARNAIDMASVFAGANTAIQGKLSSLYQMQISMAQQAAANEKFGAEARWKQEASETAQIKKSLRDPVTGRFTVVDDYYKKFFNKTDTTSTEDAKGIEEARANQARYVQDKMARAATQRARNEAIRNKLASGKYTLGFDKQAEKIHALVGEGKLSKAEAIKMTNKLYKDMVQGADKITIGAAGAKILQNAANSGAGSDGAARKQAEDYQANLAEWVAGGMVGAAPQMGDLRGEGYENAAWSDTSGRGTNKGLTDVNNDGKINAYDYIKMANGGIINEPIFGIGRSGQKYAFGESGREFVTPERKAGGTVFNVININVGNVSRDADFDKLKPLIQRWILESNSRRGII